MIKLALLLAAVQALAPAQGKKFVALGWEFIYAPPAVIVEHDLADALAASAAGCGAVYSEIQKGKQ